MTDSVTLKKLLDQVSSRRFIEAQVSEERGLAETLPFPFLAIVGQPEMKLALLLALINPAVGGVLLIGPRGAGKTTAVRALSDLLPLAPRSLCPYGCLPEDVEEGGMEAVCPDCARKYGQGEPLAALEPVRLVELPLNARLEDVIGGLNERAALHERLRLSRGLLAQADRNLLYVDEVNLLPDEIVDAILDAAAQGRYTVRRGALAGTYHARVVLVGSMNPEEGTLRPQILDRFGLRVVVRGLRDPDERLQAYRRVRSYQTSARKTIAQFAQASAAAREEIELARASLPQVQLGEAAARAGLRLIQDLRLDSLRAEITLFEAARAHAAADGRAEATVDDVRAVALMALRLRRSPFMVQYLQAQEGEDVEVSALLEAVTAAGEAPPGGQQREG